MRKILHLFFISLISFQVLSQKASVLVAESKNVAASEWQILDEHLIPVFSGSEYFREDSLYFSLEANKRYFIEVSVSDVFDTDTSIYCLFINGEAILRIKSDITPGDHLFPFFTGGRQEETKITGGTSASIADYPWQVFYESGRYTCGGSIIGTDWIITAAIIFTTLLHCVLCRFHWD